MNTSRAEAVVTFVPRKSRASRARFRRLFTSVCVSLSVAGAAVTIVRCRAMSSMGGMPMAGGWNASMVWMRQCGQTWPHAAASFLAMWMAMTLAMMLPVLAPGLWRYGQRLPVAASARLGGLSALAAAYFLVWAVSGLAVYSTGAALATLALQSPLIARLAPLATAMLVATTGVLQLSAWKKRQLELCRSACCADHPPSPDACGAWRHGLRLGLHCNACCAPMTLTLLALGVMDLRVMVAATIAIAAERLAPGGQRIARASGVLMLVAGFALGLDAS